MHGNVDHNALSHFLNGMATFLVRVTRAVELACWYQAPHASEHSTPRLLLCEDSLAQSIMRVIADDVQDPRWARKLTKKHLFTSCRTLVKCPLPQDYSGVERRVKATVEQHVRHRSARGDKFYTIKDLLPHFQTQVSFCRRCLRCFPLQSHVQTEPTGFPARPRTVHARAPPRELVELHRTGSVEAWRS